MMFRSSFHQLYELHRLALVVMVIGWLAGIVLANDLMLPTLPFICAGGLALLVCILYRQQPGWRLSALFCLCFCLGVGRFALASPATNRQMISAFFDGQTVSIQGTLTTEPLLDNSSTLLLVSVEDFSLDHGQTWHALQGELEVQMPGSTFDDPYSPHYGDTIEVTGKLLAVPSSAAPDVLANMAFPALSIEARNGNPLLTLLYQWRTNLAGLLLQALPQPFAALLIALFLSLRLPALRSLLPVFNLTGTAHLLAPSGFKITIVGGLIASNLRWLVRPASLQAEKKRLPVQRRQGRWKHWLQSILAIGAIALYTCLSGAGPAALRAGIMGSLLLLAPRLERRYTVSTALALAAFLLTACDPFVLWDTGFQLSFLGTLGIVLWMPFFTRLFAFLAHLPLGTYMAEMVAVTLAAQVATLPILALNFNTISFVAPLANLLSVPLLGLFLILGVLICLGGLIALPLALACSWLAWPLLWYLLAVLNWCSHLPGAYLPVSHLNPLLIWGYYLFVGLATLLLAGRPASTVTRAAPAHHLTPRIQQSKRIGLICVALLVILSIALASNITPTTQPLSITLLIEQTVGEGQALFLKTPDGQTALINEGASSTVLADTLDPRLPFWQRSLTLLVLPDTNAANLAGAQDILNRYQLGRVVDGGMLHPSTAYALWRKTLAARDLPYTQMRQGATLRLDKQISLQVLWPPAQLHKSSDEEQDNALVLRLRSPGLNMLFLDVASLSSYALHTLSQSISPSDLQANVVQISETAGKRFPAALATLLSLAHPTLLLIMPTPSRTRQPTVSFPSQQEPTVPAGPWQTVWTPSTNEMEIISTGQGWNFSL